MSIKSFYHESTWGAFLKKVNPTVEVPKDIVRKWCSLRGELSVVGYGMLQLQMHVVPTNRADVYILDRFIKNMFPGTENNGYKHESEQYFMYKQTYKIL
jgi:hypothetical protein